MEFDYALEYKLGKTSLVEDVLSQKAELATIIRIENLLVKRIKEGLKHDSQAHAFIQCARDGKTRRFWYEDGVF